MAIGTYQQQYYYTFYGIKGELNRVEIWNKTIAAAIVAEEVRALQSAFIVEMPKLDNKFQPVRGTGCEINLNCDSNMKFITGLYHVGYQDILIKHYLCGSLNWVGYMNSETFREPFSELNNYDVQLTGNDGFSLMDRFHFNNPIDATPYTGIKTQWEVLQLILAKIGLPFTSVNIALTTGLGYVISYSLLHNTYIDCANYYKEDGSPETLRAVLESILLPYGAFIVQSGGALYITDINNIALNSSFNFTSFAIPSGYSSTTWTNTGDRSSNPNTFEITSLGYAGTGQEIEMSGGQNKQVVNYSPYPYSTFIPNSIANVIEFQYVGASYITGTYLCSVNGVAQYLQTKSLASCTQWNGTFESVRISTDAINSTYTTLAALKTAIPIGSYNITYITTSNGFNYRWIGIDYIKVDASLSYGSAENIHALLINSVSNNLRLSLNNTKSLVIPKIKTTAGFGAESIVSGAGILIKGKFNYVPTDTYPSTQVISLRICMRASIGSNYYNGTDWSSTSSATYFYPRLSQKNDSPISTTNNCDSDGNFTMYNLGNNGADGILLPATQDLSGILTVEFWSQIYVDDNLSIGTAKIKMIWINDLSVSIVQTDGTAIPTSDAEYWGYLDDNFANEGKTVKLICGTETSMADRGKLMYLNGSIHTAIPSWVRAGQTYCIEKLLLNSLASNYKAGFYSIQGLNLNLVKSITAGSFVVGKSYTITSVDSTSFTSIGAVSNTVGVTFTATGVGSGSGTAVVLGLLPYNILLDSTYLNGHDFILNYLKIDYSESLVILDLVEIMSDSLTYV